MLRRSIVVIVASLGLAMPGLALAGAQAAPSTAGAAAAAGCPSLYLCGVHNGTYFQWKACTTHYLSHWTGKGYIFNNQTKGTVSYLYRLDNSVYVKDVAKDKTNREVNWDSVWSVRVC